MSTIAIPDYDTGNLFSIEQALKNFGLKVSVTARPEEILACDALLLPGVGAFNQAMNNIRSKGLEQPILEFVQSGKPVTGICLGLQLLFSVSHEFEKTPGLNLIEGQVQRLPAQYNQQLLRVPFVGWNTLHAGSVAWSESYLRDASTNDYFYFVHSFYVEPADERVVLSRTQHEGFEFASAIMKDNIQAFQFHPEKSGDKGLRILSNLALQLTKKYV